MDGIQGTVLEYDSDNRAKLKFMRSLPTASQQTKENAKKLWVEPSLPLHWSFKQWFMWLTMSWQTLTKNLQENSQKNDIN